LRTSVAAQGAKLDKIEIYTAWWCPGSLKAKNLLETLHIPFREIDVTKGEGRVEEMVARSGRDTVPQIFIDGEAIGGWDELVGLKADGQLDRLRQK